MATNPDRLAELEFHKKDFEQQIADVESGKTVVEITPGDGRKEAQLYRLNLWLNQQNKAIADYQAAATK